MNTPLAQIRECIDNNRFGEAKKLCEECSLEDPHILEAYALSFAGLKNIKEAFKIQKVAISKGAVGLSTYQNLAVFASLLNKHEEAFNAWAYCLSHSPNDIQTLQNLSTAALKTNKPKQAEIYLGKILELSGFTHPYALRALASLRAQSRAYEESLNLFQRLQEQTRLNANDHYLRGLIHRELDNKEAAVKDFESSLQQNPQNADCHFELSQLHLLCAAYERGFEEFEWRLKRPQAPQWNIAPELQKGEPLKGKHILVYSEQGIGDTLHFIRYLETLQKIAAHVTLLCHASLCSFLKEYAIDARPFENPISENFDHQCALMSLPHRLNLAPFQDCTLNKKPFSASPVKPLKIGICWTGSVEFKNNPIRSCGLEPLIDILLIEGIEWYSLLPNHTPAETDLLLQKNVQLQHPLSLTSSYQDTADVIKNLDHVISVDTSVAHLSGFLKCPTTLLLHTPGDWRWQKKNTQSLLYPSMSIFKQEVAHNWDKPLDTLKLFLRRLTQSQNIA